MRKRVLSAEEIEAARVAYWEARRAEGAALVEVVRLKKELGGAAYCSPRSWIGSCYRILLQTPTKKRRAAQVQAERLDKIRRCGALTRKGTPCQCKPEPGMDRCKLHGGASTGPKTEAGREAIRESNRRRAEARRAAQASPPHKTRAGLG